VRLFGEDELRNAARWAGQQRSRRRREPVAGPAAAAGSGG
jgi:hypothetical protein